MSHLGRKPDKSLLPNVLGDDTNGYLASSVGKDDLAKNPDDNLEALGNISPNLINDIFEGPDWLLESMNAINTLPPANKDLQFEVHKLIDQIRMVVTGKTRIKDDPKGKVNWNKFTIPVPRLLIERAKVKADTACKTAGQLCFQVIIDSSQYSLRTTASTLCSLLRGYDFSGTSVQENLRKRYYIVKYQRDLAKWGRIGPDIRSVVSEVDKVLIWAEGYRAYMSICNTNFRDFEGQTARYRH